MVEPTNKKRKVETVVLSKQDSFSQVLQQLEAEEDSSRGELFGPVED
jgi:hypothetical protein